MSDPLADLRAAAAKLAELPPMWTSIHVAEDLRLALLLHPEVAHRRAAMQMPPPVPANPFWSVPIHVDPTAAPGTWRALDQHGDTLAEGVVAGRGEAVTGPRRLRTQAERDADGTAWHPGGLVAGEPVHVDLHPDECVLVIREGVGVMCVRADHDHSPLAEAQDAIRRVMDEHLPALGEALAELAAEPRRRWWHRYTRRA